MSAWARDYVLHGLRSGDETTSADDAPKLAEVQRWVKKVGGVT